MAAILEKFRTQYTLKIPRIFESLQTVVPKKGSHLRELGGEEGPLVLQFSHLRGQPTIQFESGTTDVVSKPIKIGVVLSGGQAPGGHNVIIGIFDALKKLHPESQLIGFLEGPKGIIKNQSIVLTSEKINPYRNTGGFDLVGSGRTKIETESDFEASLQTVLDVNLDGLVVIGGDDSNTNAALLAEYFLEKGLKTKVVGVPKTIDGDLKNKFIEASFGFDTACKTYAEIVGNVMRDALSAKKYWFFVKLMGRSASHIALEVALQTRPNLVWLGEEVAAQQRTLSDLVQEACDLISARAAAGKDYGVILIPEGIVEFIPEMKRLIRELNTLLAKGGRIATKVAEMRTREERCDYVLEQLSSGVRHCFISIPLEVRAQLLIDRDPHGNVQVSKIETERLFIAMVKEELAKRAARDQYKGAFSPQPMFLGYEGRSALPSNFDCQYCYALGYTAALLLNSGKTGYICSVQNLTQPVEDWKAGGIPLISMIHLEEREGGSKPVIQKALVDLEGAPFSIFKEKRGRWGLEDAYRFPGPIQFYGPIEVAESVTLTLEYEREESELWAF